MKIKIFSVMDNVCLRKVHRGVFGDISHIFFFFFLLFLWGLIDTANFYLMVRQKRRYESIQSRIIIISNTYVPWSFIKANKLVVDLEQHN